MHMWLIFIASAILIGLAALVFVWVANKVFIAMKRDNQAYDAVSKNIFEQIKNKGENDNDK